MGRVSIKRSMGLEHRLLGIASTALRKAGWHCHKAAKALYERATRMENGFDQNATALLITAIVNTAGTLANASIAIDNRRIAIANRVIEQNQRILDALLRPTNKGGEA